MALPDTRLLSTESQNHTGGKHSGMVKTGGFPDGWKHDDLGTEHLEKSGKTVSMLSYVCLFLFQTIFAG